MNLQDPIPGDEASVINDCFFSSMCNLAEILIPVIHLTTFQIGIRRAPQAHKANNGGGF
jgi:hypothetical protein